MLNSLDLFLDHALFFLKFMVSLIIDQADFPAFFAKTEICVVLAEKQTILSTACHHSIRLMVFFCYQIIDKNTDICL